MGYLHGASWLMGTTQSRARVALQEERVELGPFPETQAVREERVPISEGGGPHFLRSAPSPSLFTPEILVIFSTGKYTQGTFLERGDLDGTESKRESGKGEDRGGRLTCTGGLEEMQAS